MAINQEEYTRTFSSYSGADIVATFNGRIIGELQGITYSVAREVAPIYTMGSADARSFSRGKRGISGSLVFVQFDRDALLEEMKKDYSRVGNVPGMLNYQTFRANAGDYESQVLSGLRSTRPGSGNVYGIEAWDEKMTQLGYGGADFNPDNLTDFYVPEYADQLMPFNITITMANEFGQRSGMEIHGIQLLEEGSGFSIDDVIIAKAYTFVARKIKGVEKKDNLRQEGRSSAQASQGQSFSGGTGLQL